MIGVGITTYRRPENCERVVRAVRETFEGPVFVSIDGRSEDWALDTMRRLADVGDITFAAQDRGGSVRNKNRVIRYFLSQPVCDWVVLVEDDVLPTRPAWADVMVDACIESKQGALQRVPRYGPWVQRIQEGERMRKTYDTATVCWGFWATATILCVPTSTFDRVGLFDEGFDRWGHGHVEWQYRLHAAGLVDPVGHAYIAPEDFDSYAEDIECVSSVHDERHDPDFRAAVKRNEERMQQLRAQHEALYGQKPSTSRTVVR